MHPAGLHTIYASVNGILLWLYLPLILVLFGIHKYVVPIHHAFPMMMVNAVVLWLLCVNVIGLILFRRWYKKRARTEGIMLFAITAVLSTWLYQLTGTVYPGAILNSLIITWVFASSQVIAPIPV